MKKLWLSSYSLKLKNGGSSRQGFLLKLQTSNFEAGYADIFPWEIFGDPIFSEIPKDLVSDNPSLLVRRSLQMAEKDGKARAEGHSLSPIGPLKNHFLISSLHEKSKDELEAAKDLGFSSVKIKVGSDWSVEYPLLKTLCLRGWKLRLDFNCRAKACYFDELIDLKDHIEFIEDPFPNPNNWNYDYFKELWAFDHPGFDYDKVNTNWQIFKPAKQTCDQLKADKIIVTSYLDHPIGIRHAASEASPLGETKFDYGLLSHENYESTDFHGDLAIGPQLRTWNEPGIGMTEILENQDWTLIHGS